MLFRSSTPSLTHLSPATTTTTTTTKTITTASTPSLTAQSTKSSTPPIPPPHLPLHLHRPFTPASPIPNSTKTTPFQSPQPNNPPQTFPPYRPNIMMKTPRSSPDPVRLRSVGSDPELITRTIRLKGSRTRSRYRRYSAV